MEFTLQNLCYSTFQKAYISIIYRLSHDKSTYGQVSISLSFKIATKTVDINLVIISKTNGTFQTTSLYNSLLSPLSQSPKTLSHFQKTKPKPTKPNSLFSHFFRHFPGKKKKKMSAGLGKCSKIRHIVRLRQMLRRWRNKARLSANRIPSDVPAGHVAVCVGSSCRRFVVRATHLNHPIFKKLLVQAEEEYGFNNQGPLAIPCDESLFEEVLRFISRSESGKNGNNPTRFVNLEDFQRYCHVGIRNNLDFWPESRPLLHGIADKTIW